jgi:predicted pyridoxine 5'-phosphate oxidase superfamily flavin-nucleotide-binding protein
MSAQIPAEAKAALEAPMPASLVTCANDGTPNVTVVSKVYYVDESHLAVSFQFFSKTIRNVRENPRVRVMVADLMGLCDWQFDLEYVRSETEGPLFDEMDMAIEAIASMTGMTGVFKLKAADVYKVLGVKKMAFVEAG